MKLRTIIQESNSVELEKSKIKLMKFIESELNKIEKEAISNHRTFLYQTILYQFKNKIEEL